MQKIFEKVKYLTGNFEVLKNMPNVPALPLFSDSALNFLNELSEKLLFSKVAREYPDIAAYAFWIRRAYTEKIRKRYDDGTQRLGWGVAFHITPSNIPVQFAVSMTYALTAGNASVIRVSDKEFPQVDIICRAIREVIRDKCPEIFPYICIIRYGHDDAVTEKLSAMCDVRMIWGGDGTISRIRKFPVRPRCIDIGFADRYSIAVIDSEAYLKLNPEETANDFYNDTYFSDQNACSAARIIVWLGEKISEAKKIFWSNLEKLVEKKYRIGEIAGSEKLLKTALCAANHPGIKEIRKNNFTVRVELPELYEDIMEYKGNSGYFFEYNADNIEEIIPLFKKECQTVTFIGEFEDELRSLIRKHGVRGVDRIVRVGHGSDLAFVWDGLDLPHTLSRQTGNI